MRSNRTTSDLQQLTGWTKRSAKEMRPSAMEDQTEGSWGPKMEHCDLSMSVVVPPDHPIMTIMNRGTTSSCIRAGLFDSGQQASKLFPESLAYIML